MTTNSIPTPYRLRNCPECGYSLEGHGNSGACPECAFRFGSDIIVVFGRIKMTVRTKIACVIFALFALGGLAMFVMCALAGMWRVAFSGLPPVTVAGSLFWREYRSRKMRPGPLQLRLSPEGHGYREGTGPVRLKPWAPSTAFHVRRFKDRPPQMTIEEGRILVSETTFIVDVDPQTAEWINQQVQGWIKASA